LNTVDKDLIDKRPKGYLELAFVVAGMVVGFLGYLIYSNVTGADVGLAYPATVREPAITVQQGPIVQVAGAEEVSLSPSAFLGVEIIAVNAAIAEQLDIPSNSGILINRVIPNSPAQKAGLQRGDFIVALNNSTVKDVDGFRQIIAELNPGDRVRIVFIRDGQKDMAHAVIAESPTLLETAQENKLGGFALGVSLSPLSSTLRRSLNIPSDIAGVLVLSVVPGGAADGVGLVPGDVIMSIDKAPISNMDDFFSSLSADRDSTALLDIYSQGQRRYVPMDSSSIKVADQTQTQTTLKQRIFSIFTGGSPFSTETENVILTEHTNEEEDFKKPVCKRLEESGERYDEEN